MLVLLNFFGSYSQITKESSVILPPTGEFDSIKISIDNVRTINKKLIEARFDKETIKLYKELNDNRARVIDSLTVIVKIEKEQTALANRAYEKQVKHKNFWFGTTCGLGAIVIILILL